MTYLSLFSYTLHLLPISLSSLPFSLSLRIKSNSHSSSYTSYRYHAKEKALKIYTDDDDVPNDGTKES